MQAAHKAVCVVGLFSETEPRSGERIFLTEPSMERREGLVKNEPGDPGDLPWTQHNKSIILSCTSSTVVILVTTLVWF